MGTGGGGYPQEVGVTYPQRGNLHRDGGRGGEREKDLHTKGRGETTHNGDPAHRGGRQTCTERG